MATTEAPPTPPDAKDEKEELREPLLDISAIAPERPTVRIRTATNPDGDLYELKLLAEFGIADQQTLVRDGQDFDKLFGQPTLTGNERKKLKNILDRMFEKVLVADAKLKAECNDHVRSQVITAFTVAPLVMAQEAARTDKVDPEPEETPEEDPEEPGSTTET